MANNHSGPDQVHGPYFAHLCGLKTLTNLSNFFQLCFQCDDPFFEVVDVAFVSLGFSFLDFQLEFDALKARFGLREGAFQMVDLVL